ncbi:MAG: sensor histidine kinase [Candidatus Acetothermia bacterium]
MTKRAALFVATYILIFILIYALELTNPFLLGSLVVLPGLLGAALLGFRASVKNTADRFQGWGTHKYAEKIFQNSSNMLFVVDREGNVLRRNRASRETLGRAGRDNLNVAEIVHPEDLDRVKSELKRMFDGGYIRDLQLRVIPEKSLSEAEETIPVVMQGNSVTDYAGVIEFANQQEQHRLRRKLRESAARYRYLIEDAIDTLDSGVVLIDKNREVVWLNETMEHFFGIDRENIIGLSANRALRTYVDSFDSPEDFLEVAEGAYASDEYVGNHTCYLTDGLGKTQRILEYRSIPIETDRYAGGRIEHYIDITEVKRLERNLREKTRRLKNSNEKLEEFSRGISHDLKAPLQTLEGYSQMLLEDYSEELGEDGRSKLEALSHTSQRLRDRIEGLLTYSSIEVREDSFERVDLGRLLSELREDLEYVLEDVDLRVPDEFPPLRGNPTLITELFSNLISNAVKYNDKEVAKIEIGWENSDGIRNLLWVKDNGQGIKERYLEKIFKVFEKLNPRENPEGTGIGLALCKRIVEEHGGRIWAESEVGEGTTFYFTLPGDQIRDQSSYRHYSDGEGSEMYDLENEGNGKHTEEVKPAG